MLYVTEELGLLSLSSLFQFEEVFLVTVKGLQSCFVSYGLARSFAVRVGVAQRMIVEIERTVRLHKRGHARVVSVADLLTVQSLLDDA